MGIAPDVLEDLASRADHVVVEITLVAAPVLSISGAEVSATLGYQSMTIRYERPLEEGLTNHDQQERIALDLLLQIQRVLTDGLRDSGLAGPWRINHPLIDRTRPDRS